MSSAVTVASLAEQSAKVQRLVEEFAATTAKTMLLCGEVRQQASAVRDEVTVWQSAIEEAAIVQAYRDAKAALNRFRDHIEHAAQP